jgi:hypothetical protein
MADFGTLFTLTLVALTFVIVGVCFIVYIMVIGEREKRKMAESGIVPDESLDFECPHSFGYLSGYPSDQPIPDECFGCANAIQCMNHGTESAVAVADKAAEPE